MMVMKRSLALALAGLLLVGLLAGCGRRSTSAASSVSQAPSSSESQPASSVPHRPKRPPLRQRRMRTKTRC